MGTPLLTRIIVSMVRMARGDTRFLVLGRHLRPPTAADGAVGGVRLLRDGTLIVDIGVVVLIGELDLPAGVGIGVDVVVAHMGRRGTGGAVNGCLAVAGGGHGRLPGAVDVGDRVVGDGGGIAGALLVLRL